MVNDAGAQDDVRISHNLIHDIANSTIDDTDESDVCGIFLDLTSNTKVSNNIVYNIFNNSTNGASNPDGIEVQNVATTFYAYNNTFYNIQNNGSTAPARGINDGASKLVVRNNYVGLVGGLGGGVCFNGPFAAENNNVSSDATAAGAGSQINKSAYASYFVSTTGGSENLHLLNDSFTLWGSFGADLDSDPNLPVTDDIDGGARDATTPDIGADEFGAAGVSLTLANHDVGQVGDQFTTTSSVTAALFRFHLHSHRDRHRGQPARELHHRRGHCQRRCVRGPAVGGQQQRRRHRWRRHPDSAQRHSFRRRLHLHD